MSGSHYSIMYNSNRYLILPIIVFVGFFAGVLTPHRASGKSFFRQLQVRQSAGYGLSFFQHKTRYQYLLKRGKSFYLTDGQEYGDSETIEYYKLQWPYDRPRRERGVFEAPGSTAPDKEWEKSKVNDMAQHFLFKSVAHIVEITPIDIFCDVSNRLRLGLSLGGGMRFHGKYKVFLAKPMYIYRKANTKQKKVGTYEPAKKRTIFFKWMGSIGFKFLNLNKWGAFFETGLGMNFAYGSLKAKKAIERRFVLNGGLTVERKLSNHCKLFGRVLVERNYELNNFRKKAHILYSRQLGIFNQFGLSFSFQKVEKDPNLKRSVSSNYKIMKRKV